MLKLSDLFSSQIDFGFCTIHVGYNGLWSLFNGMHYDIVVELLGYIVTGLCGYWVT